MKKAWIILPIMAGAVFLGGCGKKDEAPKATEKNNSVEEKSAGAKKENVSDRIAGGLKDLLSMGKTMECVSLENGVETKVYIKGEKYKSVTKSKETSMVGIFDSEAFYGWDTKTKAGTKMTMACIKDLEKNMPKSAEAKDEEIFSSADELIEEEAKNDNCKEASEDVDFSIPTDISFVDQCAMLKGISENMKDFQIPTE
ncbi:MAG: hypothetical protein ACD_15C00014G0001 [uncultured bacterium]|nr:MAG: hypothetical protein ACD_15C00014G0001 [uncultured bacterium]HCU70176.1 hypothetical protein [Candidatus Moranbacteria bacterium]